AAPIRTSFYCRIASKSGTIRRLKYFHIALPIVAGLSASVTLVAGVSRANSSEHSLASIWLDWHARFLPNSPSLRGSESGGGSFPRWVLRLFRTLAMSESNPVGMRGRTMNLLIRLKRITPIFFVALVLTCVGLGLSTTVFGGTNVIYSFAGDEDGEYADTDLEADGAGNIYGTTVLGGHSGSGTVFRLSPTPNGWVHTVLYSFTGGADGGEPYKGVTLDREGNLYGTAVTGGSGSCEGGCGVVCKLTNSGGTWIQTVIHAFTGGDDGSGAGARVTLDRSGNVYGMAPTGGAYGLGTIYKINQEHNGTWNLTVIHAFTGGADGASGSAGRMVLRHCRLFGA